MKKHMTLAALVAGWMFLAPGAALAQSTGKVSTMEEVVVTASKAPRTPGNVTQKIGIIDAQEMDRTVSGNRNLAELLLYEPGIFISVLSRNDANWGSSGGMSQKYNTYMLDGLPIDVFVDPQALSKIGLERIEVQRGPASVLYPNYLSMDFAGNQSPLTGTTNLITKEKISDPQTIVDAFYGTWNTLGGRVYHQNAFGNMHVFFGGDFEQSDYTNYGADPSWLNMIDDPEYQKTKLFLKTTAFFNDTQDHKLSLFINRATHQGDTGRPNRDFDHEYWLLNAHYALPLSETITANIKAGYRSYDRTWEEDNYPANLSLRSEDGVKQEIVPLDLSFSFAHGNGSLFTLGADAQYASYRTFSEALTKETGNDADATQLGIYAQEEFAWNQWLLRAGLRYATTEHHIDLLGGQKPGRSSDSWDKLLWSLGARYTINEMVAVYSNVGTSFVAPGLKSVGGTLKASDKGVPGKNGQLPNPDLKPESGLGVDLGADITPLPNLTVGLRGFSNLVEDQIVDVRVSDDPSQSQSINAGDTTTYGFEASIKHKLVDWLAWFANYTYTHSEINNSKDPDQDGAEVPFVPEHMGNIGVDLFLPYDFTLSAYLHLAGSIYDSTSKSGRQKFDPYHVLNVHAEKAVVRNDSYRMDVYADIYNLTNQEYEMPWQFQDPGFSAIVGMKMTF